MKNHQKNIGVDVFKRQHGKRRNAIYIEGTELYYPVSGF